jgi:hypothetical protein
VQTSSDAHWASYPKGTGGGVLSPGVKRGWGLKLTTPPLVPRSWMSRSCLLSPLASAWRAAGQLYFTVFSWLVVIKLNSVYRFHSIDCQYTEFNSAVPSWFVIILNLVLSFSVDWLSLYWMNLVLLPFSIYWLPLVLAMEIYKCRYTS